MWLLISFAHFCRRSTIAEKRDEESKAFTVIHADKLSLFRVGVVGFVPTARKTKIVFVLMMILMCFPFS